MTELDSKIGRHYKHDVDEANDRLYFAAMRAGGVSNQPDEDGWVSIKIPPYGATVSVREPNILYMGPNMQHGIIRPSIESLSQTEGTREYRMAQLGLLPGLSSSQKTEDSKT